MPTDISTLKSKITENGYRLTKAREATFKLLINPEPQSMSELLAKAKEANIDRVSVYRNIDLFEKLGIVHRITIGWKYKLELSDEFMEHHHHLTCLGCGKVIDIADEKHIEQFIQSVADQSGFKVRKHLFEIDGYCPKCQQNSNKNNKPTV
jgi:Fe2+ or Zn2+ uptake regulation protein